MYTADLADLVPDCQVNFHLFADDSQIYVHCPLSGVASAFRKLENCITDIEHWIPANRLKLNTDKTELLWVGSRHNLTSPNGCPPSLRLGADVIKASDLGVMLASDLSLDGHVSSVCKTCFFWLRQLRRVRRSLDTESTKTLVHAFVASREDYCNSVLASAPKTITDQLQRVLNAAACLTSNTGKYIWTCPTWTVTAASWRPALAGRTSAGPVQAGGDRSSLSPEPSASIPRRSSVIPVSDVAGRRHLRSAARHQLTVPRIRRSALVPLLLLVPQLGIHCLTCVIQLWGPEQFRRDLKTHLFRSRASQAAHWRWFSTYLRYINVHLPTYLLTYYSRNECRRMVVVAHKTAVELESNSSQIADESQSNQSRIVFVTTA